MFFFIITDMIEIYFVLYFYFFTHQRLFLIKMHIIIIYFV